MEACPWSQYLPATIHFCEAQICAWIVKPAETWSNLGYVFMGLYVTHRSLREKNGHLFPLGIIGILLGIGSGLFHATGTFFGEFLDVSGMFMYATLGLAVAARRLLNISMAKMKLLFISVQSLSMLTLWFVKPIGIALFSLQFIAVLISEIMLYRRDHLKYRYNYFFLFIGSFGLAWVIWWLDLLKIVCDPNNHWINGHALWHLITSLSFYFNYQHLKQIPELRK